MWERAWVKVLTMRRLIARGTYTDLNFSNFNPRFVLPFQYLPPAMFYEFLVLICSFMTSGWEEKGLVLAYGSFRMIRTPYLRVMLVVFIFQKRCQEQNWANYLGWLVCGGPLAPTYENTECQKQRRAKRDHLSRPDMVDTCHSLFHFHCLSLCPWQVLSVNPSTLWH